MELLKIQQKIGGGKDIANTYSLSSFYFYGENMNNREIELLAIIACDQSDGLMKQQAQEELDARRK